jgi:hypothetical protein
VRNKTATNQTQQKRDRRKKTLLVGQSPWQSQAAGGCKTYTTRVQLSAVEVILQGSDRSHMSEAEALGQLIMDHPELLRSDLKLVVER